MGLLPNSKELLKGNTPTLILSVLLGGPLHGYGIAREIERRSERALSLKEGTLYPVLHSLEREGWVMSEWIGEPAGRRSRIYRLTPKGQEELDRRRSQWEAFSRAMNTVLARGKGA
jgi:PadR family transcriptional regulator PadR